MKEVNNMKNSNFDYWYVRIMTILLGLNLLLQLLILAFRWWM